MQQPPRGLYRDQHPQPAPPPQPPAPPGVRYSLWRPSFFGWGFLFGGCLFLVLPFLLLQHRTHSYESLARVVSTLCGALIGMQFVPPLIQWLAGWSKTW